MGPSSDFETSFKEICLRISTRCHRMNPSSKIFKNSNESSAFGSTKLRPTQNMVRLVAIYCCIVHRYCCCVVDRHYFFFFLQEFSMNRMLVISLFPHVESSPFCNRYYLFTFSFLSKQTRHGRNIVSFYFFLFMWSR